MAMVDWRDEMSGDPLDLVETEWDAEIDRRLRDVLSERVTLLDHAESMRTARERLAARPRGRSVA